jgi:hypothetical protein
MFAGKNKIINGGFDVWQRGTSFTGFGAAAYTADRWLCASNSATYTVARQTSSTSEPVGSKYFARVTATVAGNFDMNLCQPFESTVLDSLKGKTVTLSFYAKASTTLTLNSFVNRNDSEGKVYYYEGTTINNTAFSLSTSWNRYSVTFAMPNKSVTNQGLQLSFQTAMTLNQYYDIWGIQLEEGSNATSFVPAGGGNIGAELALCQRYYQILAYIRGIAINTTQISISPQFPTTMRIGPTAGATGPLNAQLDGFGYNATQSSFAKGTEYAEPSGTYLTLNNWSGLTAGRSLIVAVPVNNGYVLTLSAEL